MSPVSGRILLIRHGRTIWNETGYLQGQTDVPLSRAGHEKTASLATHLSEAYDIKTVITSPLKRSLTTAEYIAKESEVADYSIESDFQERSFGRYEGELARVAFDTLPAIHPRSPTFDPTAAPPGGESVLENNRRVMESWSDLVSEMGSGETVVLVTHTTPIRLILGAINGDDVTTAVRNHQQSTGEATALSVEGADISIKGRETTNRNHSRRR